MVLQPRSLIIPVTIQINLHKYLLFYCLQESHDHSVREKTSMLQKFLLPEFKISVQNRGQHFDASTLNKVTDDLFYFHKFYTERKAIWKFNGSVSA